ncbi:MAG: hypothetical protein DVB26_07810 [Verrucomicrobia bacterium]|nr:MAG: hypothetical protein DVB26_07810 [Verrucomicrobiota bacterium]
MNRNLQRGKVALALLVILASGIALGWYGHDVRKAPVEISSGPNNAADAATHWTDRAMVTLSQELQLTAGQQQKIRPVLQEASRKMDLDRERALFQLHLQVLRVHDELRPHLRPDQVPALERMSLRLRQDIKTRFAPLLKDPALPPPDL